MQYILFTKKNFIFNYDYYIIYIYSLGVGKSGMNWYHGKWGFDSFSHLKPCMIKKPVNFMPFTSRYPPFTNTKKKILKLMYEIADIK